MSTRATILIKGGQEAYRIYHHSDGYPEGVGKDLKEYLGNKGDNKWWPNIIANEIIKGKVAGDENYELAPCQHGDEEYAYLIDCTDRKLKCYKLNWNDTDWTDSKLVEIP